jgi:8-oxo-dGTP pyrophosphatase MutT (NUDIX family)
MKPWRTVARKTVLAHSKWLTVEDHAIELPDGKIIRDWPWIISPDYVNVAVMTRAGEFLCFRQTKYAVEGVSLAPIGGYLDAGEDPLSCAKRELAEETGYEATQWHALGMFPADGNHGAGNAHLFLAEGAWKVRETISDDLEEQEMVLLSRAQVVEALLRGEFKVLSWTTVMAMACVLLESRQVKAA